MLHKLMMAMMVLGLVGGMLFFTGCRRDAGRHPDPERIAAKIAERLDLDETQQARLTEIVFALEADLTELHDAEPDPHQMMADMIRSERLDGVALEQLYTTKRETVDQMAEKVIPALVDFHAILTPEQRETLAARIEDHELHRRCRFARR